MLKWITDFTYQVEIQATEMAVFFKLASEYYRDVILNEASLANISSDDHILCIGGGVCPFSAILLHRITGARVTVIDNNAECVPIAGRVIDRLGIGGSVRVLCEDALDTDLAVSEYSVIHMAMQVSPLNDVFARMEKLAAPGTRLLVRRPRKYLGGMYCKHCGGLPKSVPYITHTTAGNIGSTLMYIKSA
ncbi:MAG: hypothetical protein FWD98_05765 [Defluviitaleaceae bacterium]|nr:hypothetical protein [Defluviitaleaceae bacterium]